MREAPLLQPQSHSIQKAALPQLPGIHLPQQAHDLEEEANDLATSVLAASLLVHEHAVGGGHDQVAELAGGQDVGGQLLDLFELFRFALELRETLRI